MSEAFLIGNIAVAVILITASYFDLKERRIPDFTVLAMFMCGVLDLLCTVMSEGGVTEICRSLLLEKALGLIVAIIVCISSGFVSKDGLGGGDIKMLSALGFTLGINKYLQTMIFTAVCSLVVTLVLLVARRIEKDATLPFAPFMVLGLAFKVLTEFMSR